MGAVVLCFQQAPRGEGAMVIPPSPAALGEAGVQARHTQATPLKRVGGQVLGSLSCRSHCLLGLPASRRLSSGWLPWGG